MVWTKKFMLGLQLSYLERKIINPAFKRKQFNKQVAASILAKIESKKFIKITYFNIIPETMTEKKQLDSTTVAYCSCVFKDFQSSSTNVF